MSTQAKAAKEALDLAVSEHKRCIMLMKKCLTATTINHRTLTTKRDELSEALKSLNSHHTAWVAKAGLSNEELAEESD